MATRLDELFEDVLQKRVLEEIERLKASLASGMVPDYAEYRYHAGQIHALEKVIGPYAEDARKEINAS